MKAHEGNYDVLEDLQTFSTLAVPHMIVNTISAAIPSGKHFRSESRSNLCICRYNFGRFFFQFLFSDQQ